MAIALNQPSSGLSDPRVGSGGTAASKGKQGRPDYALEGSRVLQELLDDGELSSFQEQEVGRTAFGRHFRSMGAVTAPHVGTVPAKRMVATPGSVAAPRDIVVS